MRRIIFRIIFEALSLKDAAELEEKLVDLLQEYGAYDLEINALSMRVPPAG